LNYKNYLEEKGEEKRRTDWKESSFEYLNLLTYDQVFYTKMCEKKNT